LGSFSTSGKALLEEIKVAVRKLGYEPLLLDEVPDEPASNLQQKVDLCARLARFVIFEDSEKSGHLFELPLCKAAECIMIVLRRYGIAGSTMSLGIDKTSKVIQGWPYEPGSLETTLCAAFEWAEKVRSGLQANYDEVFPWRTP
jgi:hypothetical protein